MPVVGVTQMQDQCFSLFPDECFELWVLDLDLVGWDVDESWIEMLDDDFEFVLLHHAITGAVQFMHNFPA